MSGLFAALSVSAVGWVGLLMAGLVLAAFAYWLGHRRAAESAARSGPDLVETALQMVETGSPSVERDSPPLDEVARARAAKTPARPAAAPPVERPAVRGRLSGIRVLAVDDDGDWREILARILATAGAEARLAPSAREALRLLDDWRPDVVLSDLAMPGMDGYALLDAIAARRGAGRLLPMVAMSAHGSAHERIRTARAGFVAHLTKPVLADELIKILGRAAAGPAQGAREERRVV